MADASNSNVRFLRLRKLNNFLRAQLATVDAVPGTLGWMITNPAGEVLVSSLPAAMDQRTLDVVGRNVSRACANAFGESAVSEMEIGFGAGNLAARAVGNGWLSVYCQARGDLAMARVTLSVTAAALQNDAGFQNDLRASAAQN